LLNTGGALLRAAANDPYVSIAQPILPIDVRPKPG
jgi:hypothetical protein